MLVWKRSGTLLRVAGNGEREEKTDRAKEGRKPLAIGGGRKMGYAPFALRYTAQLKSIRMVIRE